jgi:hypothetical protein
MGRLWLIATPSTTFTVLPLGVKLRALLANTRLGLKFLEETNALANYTSLLRKYSQKVYGTGPSSSN